MPSEISERQLFPRDVARDVFMQIAGRFQPEMSLGKRAARCTTICAVGGYRRGKAEMKDLEILYVPAYTRVPDPGDLFGATIEQDDSERVIAEMIVARIIEPRLGVNGARSWGPAVKLATHIPTGLPVDIYATSAAHYYNRLVVTTGPKEFNIRVASAAHKKGYDWEVFQGGFVPRGLNWQTAGGARITMHSEQDLFKFVGMPYLSPKERRQ